jgi:hypothetical protein
VGRQHARSRQKLLQNQHIRRMEKNWRRGGRRTNRLSCTSDRRIGRDRRWCEHTSLTASRRLRPHSKPDASTERRLLRISLSIRIDACALRTLALFNKCDGRHRVHWRVQTRLCPLHRFG